jgi:nucleoside-diphosphate-sugar epimerase
MEFWAAMIGEPILKTSSATIFGRGNNPINFVSVEDVALYTLFALQDPRAKNRTLQVGGPENMSMNRVAEIFQRASGKPAKINHVPLPLMRVMSLLLRPFNPAMARQIKAGVLFDTTDQCFDMRETLNLFPIQMTRMEDYIQKKYL